MTLIVASLFLPQQPKFELPESMDESNWQGIDQSLTNLDNDQWQSLRAASPVYFNEQSPGPGDNHSRDSLLEEYTLPRIKSANGLDQLLTTSAEFMANLTAVESNPTQTNKKKKTPFYRIGGKKNLSVHDFFASSSESLHSTLLRNKMQHSMSSSQIPVTTTSIDDQIEDHIPEDKQKKVEPIKKKKHVEEGRFNVPKFGGFMDKNNLRLKTAMMIKESKDIFQNVPWRIVSPTNHNNSLSNALLDNPDLKWVGTMGIPTDKIPLNILNEIQVRLETDFHCFAVVLDDQTFTTAYSQYCKTTLWPILHYQLPTDEDSIKSDQRTTWAKYVVLNQMIADQCIKQYNGPEDTIWIHDYHLMLVPRMIRDKLPGARIGFFHHVSFPSSELFRCLANREQILDGILGANLVSFQNVEYMRHFLQTCNRILMADVTIPDKEIQYQGQITNLAATPMGIDPFKVQSWVINDLRVNHWRQLIKEKWTGMKLILSRDTLDKVNGLIPKLKSYEMFLRTNPEYIGKVTLLQICGESNYTGDKDLRKDMMILIDRINSLSVNINIPPPVMFLQQDLEMPQMLALYCETDLFWCNSLREGMNLTCHEFVTCSIDKHSPLMLSEFTGSASIFGSDSALLINPWDIDKVSQAVKYALFDMSIKTKQSHWKRMMKTVINNDSEEWLQQNLSLINTSWEYIMERTTVNLIDSNILIHEYMNTARHFFIFKISQPPTAHMLSIINDLSSVKTNIVYIMNSFSKSTLETLYNRISNGIGLIAENGAFVRLLDGSWYNMIDSSDWKSEVIKIFDDKVERLPGSYYKIYDSMVVFHTENALDQERVSSVIGDSMTHINTVFQESNIHAFVTGSQDLVYVQETGLSLKALKFVLRFYNSSSDSNNNMSESTSNPASPLVATQSSKDVWVKHNNEQNDPQPVNKDGEMGKPIDFICLTGSSSPIIDPMFEYVNQQLNEGVLQCGHTVVYGSTENTHALEHVNGLNGLMNIVSRLNRV